LSGRIPVNSISIDPDVVIGPPVNVNKPPVVERLTLVTVPVPLEGAAQVPSPLQNVLLDAAVPELRLVTGRFPVTPVDNGRPVQFVSVPEVGVPSTGVINVGVLFSTGAPVPVYATHAGTPELFVKRPALSTTATPETVFAAEE
jgi:hypothetical protein